MESTSFQSSSLEPFCSKLTDKVCRDSCKKKMSVIFGSLALVAAIFMILAAAQVLPASANALSSLKVVIYPIASLLMLVSIISFACRICLFLQPSRTNYVEKRKSHTLRATQ